MIKHQNRPDTQINIFNIQMLKKRQNNLHFGKYREIGVKLPHGSFKFSLSLMEGWDQGPSSIQVAKSGIITCFCPKSNFEAQFTDFCIARTKFLRLPLYILGPDYPKCTSRILVRINWQKAVYQIGLRIGPFLSNTIVVLKWAYIIIISSLKMN